MRCCAAKSTSLARGLPIVVLVVVFAVVILDFVFILETRRYRAKEFVHHDVKHALESILVEEISGDCVDRATSDCGIGEQR